MARIGNFESPSEAVIQDPFHQQAWEGMKARQQKEG